MFANRFCGLVTCFWKVGLGGVRCGWLGLEDDLGTGAR
jgi:hypothetical protein